MALIIFNALIISLTSIILISVLKKVKTKSKDPSTSKTYFKKNKYKHGVISLDELILQSPNSVIITDLDGRIEYVNPTFEKKTGFLNDEVIGKNPRILKSNKMPKILYEDMWETISNGDVWRNEVLNKKKSGELFWVSSVIFPIHDDAGKKIKYAALQIDITAKKEIQKELTKAKALAAQSDKLKVAFLANVSHEVNTPLNAIFGFTQLLKSKVGDDEKTLQYIDNIDEYTQVLISLFDDLLTYSKIDSGIFDFKPIAIKLNELLPKICSRHNVKLLYENTKKIDLSFIPDQKHSEVIVKTDKIVFTQIIDQLISNAIKFTEEGKVDIGYIINDKVIIIYVADTGLGISDEEKQNIFNLFYHGNDTYINLHKGLGLGLNIVKKYVDAINGDLDFESEPGEGSTFYFSLPIENVTVKNFQG